MLEQTALALRLSSIRAKVRVLASSPIALSHGLKPCIAIASHHTPHSRTLSTYQHWPSCQLHLPPALLYGIGYLGVGLAYLTRGCWLFKWKVGGRVRPFAMGEDTRDSK